MRVVGAVPPLRRAISWFGINSLAYAAALRPRPLTLAADYTSWKSLTDRTYSGRHLPPADPWFTDALPSEADVVDLYRRGQMIESTDTERDLLVLRPVVHRQLPADEPHRLPQNTSNHEIDLCQIYGLSEPKTDMLRAGQGGRLKSQFIDGAEHPVFLFEARRSGRAARHQAGVRRPARP